MKQCVNLEQLMEHWSQARQCNSHAETVLGELLAYFQRVSGIQHVTESDTDLLQRLVSHCETERDRSSEAFYYYSTVTDLFRRFINHRKSTKRDSTIKENT